MEEDNGKWNAAAVECPLCTRKWGAVWPVEAIELECPGCSNMIEPIIIQGA